MFAGELVRRLGHEPDWLYRKGRLEALYAEGMPRPLSSIGRRAWDRLSIEAWLSRNHPARRTLGVPANDASAAPAPADARAWAETLAAAYRPLADAGARR